jgi:hypothetical protein
MFAAHPVRTFVRGRDRSTFRHAGTNHGISLLRGTRRRGRAGKLLIVPGRKSTGRPRHGTSLLERLLGIEPAQLELGGLEPIDHIHVPAGHVLGLQIGVGMRADILAGDDADAAPA